MLTNFFRFSDLIILYSDITVPDDTEVTLTSFPEGNTCMSNRIKVTDCYSTYFSVNVYKKPSLPDMAICLYIFKEMGNMVYFGIPNQLNQNKLS